MEMEYLGNKREASSLPWPWEESGNITRFIWVTEECLSARVGWAENFRYQEKQESLRGEVGYQVKRTVNNSLSLEFIFI